LDHRANSRFSGRRRQVIAAHRRAGYQKIGIVQVGSAPHQADIRLAVKFLKQVAQLLDQVDMLDVAAAILQRSRRAQ
jgi:hypothetical protein